AGAASVEIKSSEKAATLISEKKVSVSLLNATYSSLMYFWPCADVDSILQPQHSSFKMDAPLANEHCVGITRPFEEIEDSLAHKFNLDLWEREEKVLSSRINHKDTTRMSVQNEIYQLLALYFVLQGVVLTALFQGLQAPNQNTCKSWWIPFAFSALSQVATMAAVHHKFRKQLEIENHLQQEKQGTGLCLSAFRTSGLCTYLVDLSKMI
ncbi:hypothetical protein KI387_036238, partial [Taxus chinensis]